MLACLLPTISSACSSTTPLVPSETRPTIVLSDACERLPGRIGLPKGKEGDDARVLLASHVAIGKKLNGRIAKKDQCMKNMRERFAKGGR